MDILCRHNLVYPIVIPDICCVLCSLDTVLAMPPYYVPDEPSGLPLETCWFAQSQLYITCNLRPKHRRSPTGHGAYGVDGENNIRVQLVFYSTFAARFWSGGNSLRSEVVRALTNARRLGDPRLKCAGANAFDTLISPWKLPSRLAVHQPYRPVSVAFSSVHTAVQT